MKIILLLFQSVLLAHFIPRARPWAKRLLGFQPVLVQIRNLNIYAATKTTSQKP